MNDALVDGFIVAAYLSLALELWLIPVPSIASAPALVRAERNPGDGKRRPLHAARCYLPVLINIVVFLIPLVDAVAGLAGHTFTRTLQSGSAAVGLGVLLVTLGRLLTIRSALDLRAQAELSLGRGSLDAPLTTRGLFAFSRNPGLVGMYLFALGLLLLKPSVWFAIGLLHYVWHMHRRVKIEERSLSAQFGAAYGAYRDRTRRYV